MMKYLIFFVLLTAYAVQGQTEQETSTEQSNEESLGEYLKKMIPSVLEKYEQNDIVISRLKQQLKNSAGDQYQKATQEIRDASEKSAGNKFDFCMKNSTQQVDEAYGIFDINIAECFSDYIKIAAQIIDILKKGEAEPSELIKLLEIPSTLPDKTIAQFVKFVLKNHIGMSQSKQTSCVNDSKRIYSESLDNALESFEQCSQQLQNQ